MMPDCALLTVKVTVCPTVIFDDAGEISGVVGRAQVIVVLELQSVFSAALLACEVTVNTPPGYKVLL